MAAARVAKEIERKRKAASAAQLKEAKIEAKIAIESAKLAQKLHIAKAQTKRLRKSGFKRTIGGYQFPEVDPATVLKAAKLKVLQKKLKKEGKEVP